jgi:hypothetical protein
MQDALTPSTRYWRVRTRHVNLWINLRIWRVYTRHNINICYMFPTQDKSIKHTLYCSLFNIIYFITSWIHNVLIECIVLFNINIISAATIILHWSKWETVKFSSCYNFFCFYSKPCTCSEKVVTNWLYFNVYYAFLLFYAYFY